MDIIFYISTFGVDKDPVARETRIQFKWRVNAVVFHSFAVRMWRVFTCGAIRKGCRLRKELLSEMNLSAKNN